MRQIKFRAWDKKHLRMWQFADVDSEHSCALNGYDLNGESYEKLGGEEPEEDLILLQFTGLLDKNGKEIFEGDIIRSEQWTPTTYQVAFDRGAFYIAGTDLHEVADIKYAEKFEVIGNIYENPELLKN